MTNMSTEYSSSSSDAEFSDRDSQTDVDIETKINSCPLLMPFEHQVGGHSAVMKLDETSLCKAKNPMELQFYETLPVVMQDFVPKFKGLVDVYIEEEGDGVLVMRACPDGATRQGRGCVVGDSGGEEWNSDEDAKEVMERGMDDVRLEPTYQQHGDETPANRVRGNCCGGGRIETLETRSRQTSCCKSNTMSRSRRLPSSSTASSDSSERREQKRPCCWVRVKNSGSLCIETNSEDEDSELFEDQSDANRAVTGVRKGACNPWSMFCQQQQLAKMRRPENAATCYKFMVLENCTSNYHFPCILDLKIGTRSHNDHMTEEKKRTHIAKVAATTSATVGVRAAGMQVYHVNRGRFICRNKYYGRRLTEQGLREALCKFLFNGHKFRFEVIPRICREIEALIAIIRKLPNYRFYGSSLLLVYEGLSLDLPMFASSKDRDHDHGRVSLKMIDFASVSISTTNEGPDEGYIYGLQNLQMILRDIEASGKAGTTRCECPNNTINLSKSSLVQKQTS